ncbi:MAG: DHA2 family efflux MFS transporter permease subunit [Candidatus Tectomicrobia bacterium]|uniref:DHA2 family efflux MFS transporter permease subunit n=1 Tax=Tectimicrobiota bacterium TaxID=2528274 RepID=A0A938B1J2_UNCTE|nr:DHA2 family efflux MFS transporter permease subunit [Candidatus Tectomicrobia bacterium]
MQQGQGRSHWWPTCGVLLGALTVALNIGVLNVAIPTMMSSLSTDLSRIQWVQTSYQIAQTMLMPAVGWLGARLGTKRLFLLSTLTFISSSALCGLAWDAPSLIVFRTMQGLGAGPITPLGMSILYSAFAPDKRGLAMGLYNFSFSFGPAIAPALGGHLIEVLSWRAIFYINVPVGLLSAAIIFFTMPPTQDRRADPFDALGVCSMAGFLVPLLLAMSEGRHYGWNSSLIISLLAIAALSLIIFIVAELTVAKPFVNIRLYTNVPFAMGCVIGFLNTVEFRGTNFLLPIMLQRIFHYTPFQAGLFFLPPALVMGSMSILTGRLSDRMSPKLLLTIGLLGLIYASWQFCGIEVGVTTATILGLIILRRAAQAFCHSPLTTSAMHNVPEEQVRMASGLFNFHRTLAGVVGVAVTATLMDYLEQLHTLRLSQQQTMYPLGTQAATETIRSVLYAEGDRDVMLAQRADSVLQQILTDSAALAGYHDLFFLFVLLAIVSLVPVLLLRGGKPQTASGDHGTPSPRRTRVRGVRP